MKLNLLLLSCLTVLIGSAASASGQIITTIAGNGTAGFSGDSAVATLAEINKPFGIAVDNTGAIYFADRSNGRVRKILTSGVIVTIAGMGSAGYNSDGIPGTTAELNDPNGIAADNSGNVYIADRLNNRIRKVDAFGIITTIAGNGTSGFSGDNAAATAAQLGGPRGVAVDTHGNVFIADQGNGRIRKVDPAGIITTVAGNGTPGYNGDGISATAAELFNPYGVAVDTSGSIYIADVDNERIRKIDGSGTISTVAGTGAPGFGGDGGPATAAHVSEPSAVAVDRFGKIFIADNYNARIREITSSGIINTIAGTGAGGYNGDGIFATAAELYNPSGVAIGSAGAVYIADNNNNRIRYMPEPMAVNSVTNTLSVNIFPNPNQGTFTICVFSNMQENLLITISDVMGRTVKEIGTSTDKPVEVRLTNPPGTYIINVAGPRGSWKDKLTILK